MNRYVRIPSARQIPFNQRKQILLKYSSPYSTVKFLSSIIILYYLYKFLSVYKLIYDGKVDVAFLDFKKDLKKNFI